MVDPSLLRLAADRGVTICFADLDGADGLWVPEERTVLVNRRLSEREVAAVIEHELGHVAIDDQHADLDAGIERPRPAASRRWTAALTAAACLAVVGGVTAGLARHPGGAIQEDPVVAPSVPPLTAERLPRPDEQVRTENGTDGGLIVRVGRRAPVPSATSPAPTSAAPVSPTSSPTPTREAAPPSSATTPAATSTVPTTSPPAPEPTPTPTPAPTTASPGTETGSGLPADESLQDQGAGTGAGSGSVAAP